MKYMYIKNALLINILYIYERKHVYYIIMFVLAFAYLNKFATRYIYIFQIAQNISFPILLCLKAEESTCISKQLIGIYTLKIAME